MKFIPENRRASRFLGMGLAMAMLAAFLTAGQLPRMRRAAVTGSRTDSFVKADAYAVGTVTVPFHQEQQKDSRGDARRLYDVYTQISQSEKENDSASVTAPSQTTDAPIAEPTEATQETDSTTVPTTVTTTAPSKTSEAQGTQPTQDDETVSNGQQPFNYHDVSSIAPHLDILSDFVEQLKPVSFAWNTAEYEQRGCVRISLASAAGSVTLDVKPLTDEGLAPYTIGGETVGSVNVSSLDELEWYRQNRHSGACICSMTWYREDYPVAPVRGIAIGTGLAELTAKYLCVNGGATTLYRAADVIDDEDKLNALLASENAYTFVGGRIYTIERYLEKYYSASGNAYRFEDCDMVVQYGCNSITEHNYTTGSWLMEYAIKDDMVVGMTFMNKSYYETNVIRGGTNVTDDTGSTSMTSGGKEELPTAGTGTTFPMNPEKPDEKSTSVSQTASSSVTETLSVMKNSEDEGEKGDDVSTAVTQAQAVHTPHADISSGEEEYAGETAAEEV